LRRNTSPRWSPDGSRIALLNGVGQQNGKPAEITVMNADGSGRTVLTNDHRQAGARLVAGRGRGSPTYVSLSAGAAVTPLPARRQRVDQDLAPGDDRPGRRTERDRPTEAAVFVMAPTDGSTRSPAAGSRGRPTGRKSLHQPGPSVMGADGQRARRRPGDGVNPDWSPDGQFIIFARGHAQGIWEVTGRRQPAQADLRA
jgi:dipeptidyl aminopeptidase/acylaminoacyl peptidase